MLFHCQHTFGQPKTLRLVLLTTSLVSANLSLCPCEIMPESCSGQRQMSFVPEQMRPCFVPFLSWPPGWGSGGTLTPKLPCLTSAVAAQGTSLLGRRAAAWAIRALLLCKCQDSLAAVATAALCVCSTGYTCVSLWLHLSLCVHLPFCLSWLQEVTWQWLKAVTPALRMQSSRMWGSTGAATAESASPSCSPAYLS